MARPTAEERNEGLWSPLSGLDEPISYVRVEKGTAVIGLGASVNHLDLSQAFTGITFIESISVTALQFPGVDGVILELSGSCEGFARALGGEGCTRYEDSATDRGEARP